MPTPLHNHTYFSAYDGLATPEQIAHRVTEIGLSACGCTDHGVVAGHVEFYDTMIDNGVKPILGVETYQAPVSRMTNYKALRDKQTGRKVDNFHLILLAMNERGLRNLWAMNSEAFLTGYYHDARVDWELLEKYNEGIIVTSACFLGMTQQALADNPHLEGPETILRRYLDIFGDRFYLELGTYPAEDQHIVNLATVALAKEFGVPLVYGNDAHYAQPGQYHLHEAVIALSEKKKLSDPPRDSENLKGRPHHEPDLYIMDEQDTRKHFDYLPASVINEALDSSDMIAERCSVTLPERRNRLPIFVPDKGWGTSRDMMLDLVQDGYERKVQAYNKDEDGRYFERVADELEVILRNNLHDYFLMVRDYVYWAKEQGIFVGPGRGSVGGSLVAYLLGITQVDPIYYGLIFERFYNAGRETSLPDIDIDFSIRGRERVKKYIIEKYGAPYVADLGTTVRLHPKSAIADIARVMGLPLNIPRQLSKIIDQGADAGKQPDWDTLRANEKIMDQLSLYMEEYPQLFTWAEELEGHVKGYGVHPSGVIVGDEPISDLFPLRWISKDKKVVTQWGMDEAERFGYMKADILGLRNLDTLEEVNILLEEQGKEPIDYEALQYQDHPEEMWQLLDSAKTVGIFQIEDGGMAKQITRDIKPRRVSDLSLIVALNRPGPLRSENHLGERDYDNLLRGMAGEPVTWYPHPILEDVLEETYGMFVYQEQIIEFMTKIGYPLTEADEVRAIVGKKKVEKIEAEFERYLPRAMQYMDELTARRIWDKIVNFAKYGFNKAHSVEYAIIGLWTVFAKKYAPVEFICASIRTTEKKDLVRYVSEAQRLKIPVYRPELGLAKAQASIYKDGIMLGWINLEQFGLITSEWMERYTRPGMTRVEFEELRESDEGQIIQNNGKMKIAIDSQLLEILDRFGVWSDSPELDNKKRMEIEEELLGVAISDDSAIILEQNSELIEEYCVPIGSATEINEEYTIAGIIRELKTDLKTKNNKPYAKIKIVDDTDELDVFVWQRELKKLNFIFRTRQAGIFNIKRTSHGGSLIDAMILHRQGGTETKYEQDS